MTFSCDRCGKKSKIIHSITETKFDNFRFCKKCKENIQNNETYEQEKIAEHHGYKR